MTQMEFQLVTSLQCLKVAKQLVADARPHLMHQELEGQWNRTLRAMQAMIDILEFDATEGFDTVHRDPSG